MSTQNKTIIITVVYSPSNENMNKLLKTPNKANPTHQYGIQMCIRFFLCGLNSIGVPYMIIISKCIKNMFYIYKDIGNMNGDGL